MRLSTDRSTWLGHQSRLDRGRFVTWSFGDSMTGFWLSLPGLSVSNVPTGLVVLSYGFGSLIGPSSGPVLTCYLFRCGVVGRDEQVGQRPQ